MDTSSPSESQVIRFGVFEVDLRAGELRKQGIKIKLQQQPFQVLQALLEKPGETISRDELRRRIWPSDTFVDFEGGVNNAIKRLREALGDKAETPRFIETLPRRGYRFIGILNGISGAGTSAPGGGKRGGENGSNRDSRRLQIGVGRGLAMTALLITVLGLVSSVIWRRVFAKDSAPQIRSIAVIPLKTLSEDASQKYIAYGMAEELITDLSQLRALRVVSHTSVLRYENTDKTVPQIAKELGVDAVIEGAVQGSADRVRVTAQLIYAPKDTNLWARTYDRDLNDVLALQSTVAREIADEVRVNVTTSETLRLTKPKTVNPEALQAYWKGKYYLSFVEENLFTNDQDIADLERKHRQAVEYFEEAIRLDPNYAPAYLAYADSGDVFHDIDPSPSAATVLAGQKEALMKALALDDTLSNAHLALANFLLYYDWNWAGAEKEYRRALELNPNSAEGHCHYADFLNSMERFDEGLKEQQVQLQLDPDLQCEVFSPLLPLESHIEREKKYIETHHAIGENYWDLGLLLWKAGRDKEAVDVWQEWMRQMGYIEVAEALGRSYAKEGYAGAMREWAKAGESVAKKRYVMRCMMVYVYGVLGDNDRAFAWLEKAFAEHEGSMPSLKYFCLWDPIRSDPRFAEMVRRVGIPP